MCQEAELSNTLDKERKKERTMQQIVDVQIVIIIIIMTGTYSISRCLDVHHVF